MYRCVEAMKLYILVGQLDDGVIVRGQVRRSATDLDVLLIVSGLTTSGQNLLARFLQR